MSRHVLKLNGEKRIREDKNSVITNFNAEKISDLIPNVLQTLICCTKLQE